MYSIYLSYNDTVKLVNFVNQKYDDDHYDHDEQSTVNI